MKCCTSSTVHGSDKKGGKGSSKSSYNAKSTTDASESKGELPILLFHCVARIQPKILTNDVQNERV